MLNLDLLRSARQSGFSGALHNLPRAASKANKRARQAVLSIGALSLLALCMGCGSGTGSAVSSTSNPQVALYVFNAQSAGEVTVDFGPTTAYGFETSPQDIPSGGVPIRIFVAGMRANTLYHMRAVAKYSDGTTQTDADHDVYDGELYDGQSHSSASNHRDHGFRTDATTRN